MIGVVCRFNKSIIRSRPALISMQAGCFLDQIRMVWLRQLVLWGLLCVPFFAATIQVQSAKGLHLALKESCNNGEDDVIVLSQGDYRTDVGDLGTFVYEGVDGKNLTIQGASGLEPADVRLHGSLSHRVLELNATGAVTYTVKNLTIQGGEAEFGAGIAFDDTLLLEECLVYANQSRYQGGGIHGSTLVVSDSQIYSNTSNMATDANRSLGGGGIYASTKVTVHDSQIFLNHSTYGSGGGIDAKEARLYRSSIYKNTANRYGGGIRADKLIGANLEIYDNSGPAYGGGVYSPSYLLTNVLLWNNDVTVGGGGAYGWGSIVNSLLYNQDDDIYLDGSGKAYIQHNYLDFANLTHIDNNNSQDVFLTGNIQILDADGMSFSTIPSATSSSPFVDQGLAPTSSSFDDFTLYLGSADQEELQGELAVDLVKNERIINDAIDMGPTEYGSYYKGDAPTILSFSYSGESYTGKTLTFSYEARADDQYTIARSEIRFDSDESFEVFDGNDTTHIYDTPGTYEVMLRITDSADVANVSTATLTVTIAEFVDDATIDYLKTYCAEYPDVCDSFVTIPDVNYSVCEPEFTNLDEERWHLLGTGTELSVSSIPEGFARLFTYEDGEWSCYDANNSEGSYQCSDELPVFGEIEAGKGFWLEIPTE